MKRIVIAAVFLTAITATAQQSAPAADPKQAPVAVVNGEVITRAKLDALYDNIGAQARAQYEKAGGKMAFLDNYIAKRLMLQEAIKRGFDKKPDVQFALEAARESALFDRYIRDTIAPQFATDADARKYYDEHKEEFVTPEALKIRHIVIATNRRSKEEALERAKAVSQELRTYPELRTPAKGEGAIQVAAQRFAQAARKYSEDGVAAGGGDLGWVSKGVLDPAFEEAAFNMDPGMLSGIVETQFGYHLIFVEGKRPAGTQPFEEAKPDIREFLLAQKAADVVGAVTRLTNELRATSKVAVYPENVK